MLFKRAFLNIKHNAAKNVILLILFSVILGIALSLLVVFLSANGHVSYLQKALGSAVNLRGPILYAGDGGIASTFVDPEDALLFTDSDYVESYNYIRGDGYIDFVDMDIVLDDENRGLYEYMLTHAKDGIESDGTINALSNSMYFDAFTVYGFKLTQGEHITDDDKNAIIISEKLANVNGLTIGDEITLRSIGLGNRYSGYTEEDVKYAAMTIVGLCTAPDVHEVGYSNERGAWASPDNMVFGSFAVTSWLMDFKSEYETPQIERVTVHLKDPRDIDAFIEETRKKMNIEEVSDSVSGFNIPIDENVMTEKKEEALSAAFEKERNYSLQVDKEWYNMITKPMESIRNLIGAFILLLLLFGSLAIMVLVIAISLKGRKKEFGVLLSMGETKRSILGQVFIEILIPLLAAAIIGLFISQAAQPVIEGYSTGIIAGENREIKSDNKERLENMDFIWHEVDATASLHMWNRNPKTTVIDSSIEYQAGAEVYIVYFLVAFGVILAALAVQLLTILRINPAQMLRKQD